MSKPRKEIEILKRILALVLGIILTACASQEKSNALSGEEFKSRFKSECANITGIEELHSSTWYTVNGTHEGAHTKESFSLETMSSWLKECGRDPREVSQILE
jgi:hypothetical protein